jgi:hypothetical protein
MTPEDIAKLISYLQAQKAGVILSNEILDEMIWILHKSINQ